MKISKLLFILPVFLLGCSKKSNTTTVVTIADPLVISSPITAAANGTATSGGNVTDASNGQVVSRGVCWSINQMPSIDDVNDSRIITGSGTGTFVSTLTGLLPNKTYYVRAYATNEEGTGYGDDIVFTTSPFTIFTYNDKTIYAHPVDNGTSAWGTQGVTTAATSTSNGSDNTLAISTQTDPSYAAKICSDLVAYGYSDWYLPSSDELDEMYQNKTLLGNFKDEEYWSSTEISSTTAASQNFQTGAKSTNQPKNQLKNCRCIRKD